MLGLVLLLIVAAILIGTGAALHFLALALFIALIVVFAGILLSFLNSPRG